MPERVCDSSFFVSLQFVDFLCCSNLNKNVLFAWNVVGFDESVTSTEALGGIAGILKKKQNFLTNVWRLKCNKYEYIYYQY